MWNHQLKKQTGIKFGFVICSLGIYSATLCAADTVNFKNRQTNDEGFLVEAKEWILNNAICSHSGFRKQYSITHVSPVETYCGTENHSVNNYDFTGVTPHLRLDINLKRIEQQGIAGIGVQSTTEHSTIVDINFDSLSADLVTPNQTGLINFVGDIVANPPLPIFTAFIENGCLGSPPATFDLSLSSTIYGDLNKDQSLGSVQLYDEVVGHGYYNYNYTIRAEDDDGNVSVFTFSGDANSICVAELSVN